MLIEVQPLNELNMGVYLACGCHPLDERFDHGCRDRMKCKRDWVETMVPRGLGARIAFLEEYPAGFAEFLPIEVAPAPIVGKGLLYITEIHVNREDKAGSIDLSGLGIGKLLIRAVEQYAREQGFKGLATIALGADPLPGSFYEHMEFTCIEQKDSLHLLWLPFKECEKPALWSGNFEPATRHDGVHIDVVHTSQCPGEKTLGMWHSLVDEYGEEVTITEHLADDRSIMDIDCVPGSMGVFVNGNRVPRDPPSRLHARQVIEDALRRIPSVDLS